MGESKNSRRCIHGQIEHKMPGVWDRHRALPDPIRQRRFLPLHPLPLATGIGGVRSGAGPCSQRGAINRTVLPLGIGGIGVWCDGHRTNGRVLLAGESLAEPASDSEAAEKPVEGQDAPRGRKGSFVALTHCLDQRLIRLF